ncbi:MAG: hypothetical protein CVU34_12740 [Betaproteobacteria bacterium HGW-Betaproteobacteria-7]|jgi:hypothetical protein|nr:MAG: hypothetical protein CVU34_12740 [Betaproteobacteria bacterium HGW-Betaproteobacteria-7]
MTPQTDPLTQSSVFADWPLAASYGESMACWDPAETEEASPSMAPAGAIALAEVDIPVWRLSEGDTAAAGKFVRYCDMPAAMAAAFREQQVLTGKPFAGAAYVEDFQLFIDLRQRWR